MMVRVLSITTSLAFVAVLNLAGPAFAATSSGAASSGSSAPTSSGGAGGGGGSHGGGGFHGGSGGFHGGVGGGYHGGGAAAGRSFTRGAALAAAHPGGWRAGDGGHRRRPYIGSTPLYYASRTEPLDAPCPALEAQVIDGRYYCGAPSRARAD